MIYEIHARLVIAGEVISTPTEAQKKVKEATTAEILVRGLKMKNIGCFKGWDGYGSEREGRDVIKEDKSACLLA